MGRPKKIENLYGKSDKSKYTNPPGQSKGILDDFAVRTNVDTAEGTVQKTPINPKDIVSKDYADGVTCKLIPNAFDSVEFSPNQTTPTTIVYKLNSNTVGALTLTYNSEGNVTSVSNGTKAINITYSGNNIGITET